MLGGMLGGLRLPVFLIGIVFVQENPYHIVECLIEFANSYKSLFHIGSNPYYPSCTATFRQLAILDG